MSLSAALIGLLVGLMLGVTGAGGSILALPLLTLLLHWSVAQAAPVSSLAVGCAALLGTALALRDGLVRYKTATVMALAGFIATPLGVHAAQHAPQQVLALLFAVVLVFVALRLLARSAVEAASTRAAQGVICSVDPVSGRVRWTFKCAAILVAGGLGTGFLAGLLGVGAGFIIVPVLRRVTAISMHMIVATSLMVIALISGSAVVAALVQGVAIDWSAAIPFVAAALVGMVIGRRLAARIAGPALQRVFAAVLLLMAALMAGSAVGADSRHSARSSNGQLGMAPARLR